MGKNDWYSVSLPTGLVERLNEFLKSDFAKNNGFTSKADVLVFILRDYLDNYDKLKK